MNNLRKQTEEELKKSKEMYRKLAISYGVLNELAISLNEANSETQMFRIIAGSLAVLTGASFTTVTKYDQTTGELYLIDNHINPRYQSKDNLNYYFPNTTRWKIDDKLKKFMINKTINRPRNFQELTWGTIPKDVSDSMMQQLNIKDIIAIAINNKNELLGTAVVYLTGEHRIESDELLYIFAYISGLALKRKQYEDKLQEGEKNLARTYRQLDEEVNKAAEIHKRTFPVRIPQPEGISIAAHYQPAARMGGDFYNVIRSGNKLIIYLSDVMGHGLDGAMLSVFVKEAIDSYVTLKPEALYPGKIIKHLGKQYCHNNYPYELLICIFLGILDMENMNFNYAGAGFHIPPLVRLGNGKKEELICSGLFISNAIPYDKVLLQENNITLTAGTTVLFTTDGLPEQGNGKEWFYQYYEDIFYKNSHLPPVEIIKAINKEFYRFNNNSLTGDDDITYLVLQIGDKIKQ